MSNVEIIKQSSLKEDKGHNSVCVFGKEFVLEPISDNFRLALHEDFPMIIREDIRDFIGYSVKKGVIVISGCIAKVHPYRLMYIDKDGYDVHFADIPQSIRGNRHFYPEIYQFIPAMVAIPPNIPISNVQRHDQLDMYVMPVSKLLDKTLFLERLLISIS